MTGRRLLRNRTPVWVVQPPQSGAAADFLKTEVTRASERMGNPFRLVSGFPPPGLGAGLLWVDLYSHPVSIQGIALKNILAEISSGSSPRGGAKDRPRLLVALAGPPPDDLAAIMGNQDIPAVCSDPALYRGAGPKSIQDLVWVGLVGPDESDNGQGGRSLPVGQAETEGGMRLAKIISRLLKKPGWSPSTPLGRPLEGMVEIVRACNLRCPVCPVGTGEADKFPPMKAEIFARIAASLAPTVWKLSLYNYGEPLLHPQVGLFVKLAKAEGIEWVEIATNGNVKRPGLARELVDSGLDFLRFSADGATQATYARYRVGGDLDLVWANIQAVRRAREEQGASRPIIEAQFIVSSVNEKEMVDFEEIALAKGADRVRFKTFNVHMSGERSAQVGRRFLPQDKKLSRYKDYESLSFQEPYRLNRCRWPWERVVVNADGSIVPCCYDYNARHRLGVFPGDREDWWNTDERAEFRRGMSEEPGSIEMCACCPVGVPDLSVHRHSGED